MEENQKQERQRLLSAYNTARFSASLGKLAIQLAVRTATTIVGSPIGWIVIGIGVVVVATFLIVFSAGVPSFPTEDIITKPTTLPPTPTLNPEPTEPP